MVEKTASAVGAATARHALLFDTLLRAAATCEDILESGIGIRLSIEVTAVSRIEQGWPAP